MNTSEANVWLEGNQRALTLALARIRALLARAAGATREPATERAGEPPPASPSSSGGFFALDQLVARFRLSPFERDVLLLAAGPELESSLGELIGRMHGDPRRRAASFSLALAVLPAPHWSALSNDGPLRRWRLVEIRSDESLANSPLRVDERVLHYLCGVGATDDRLRSLFRPMDRLRPLPEAQQALAARCAELLRGARGSAGGPGPVVLQLSGEFPAEALGVAVSAAQALDARLHLLEARDLPESVAEREAIARLWEREVALSGGLVAVESSSGAEAEHRRAVSWLDQLQTSAILLSREPVTFRHQRLVRHEIARPPVADVQGLWRTELGTLASALNGQLHELSREFRLGPDAIQLVSAQLHAEFPAAGSAGGGAPASPSVTVNRKPGRRTRGPGDGGGGDKEDGKKRAEREIELAARLRLLCRAQARAPLEALAQRIEPVAAWDDLVLPAETLGRLREIVLHAKHRHRVTEEWGFAGRSHRGLGLAALFSGPSGTGKTMAAEVLARELDLELFRVDLSAVVSKYIGETEKNLRRVFDAAESGVAILLFDEADALFGRRTEVKDSHDRYANIEVSYLLQRMEAYRGVALLTTNQRSSLDDAFLRRLRFIVPFPFPDAAQRAEIWRRIFPPETPREALDFRRLAQLNVSGGYIRNIALGAAVLAAEAAEPVRMKHLHAAARAECAKIERHPGEAEIAGWL